MANHYPQRHGSHKSAAEGPLKVGILYYYPSGRAFSCFICGRQKKEKHLADLAENAGQVVCKSCYEKRGYIQIGVAVERPRKAVAKSPRTEVKRKGEPRSARQLKSPKAAKEQEPKAGPHPLSDEEARKRQAEVPALGHLVSFFESAGARVQLLSDGGLEINDGAVRRLPKKLASYGQGLLDSLIDDIALRHMRGTFIEAISENAGFGDGFRAITKRGGKEFAVVWGTTRLGYIRPTHARANDGEAIEGNFLVPGPHWQRMAEAISAEAERRREQQAKTAPRAQAQALRGQRAVRRISVLPGHLDPGLARTCMDASRRIRTERQVAYERPVILENELGELALFPITSTGIRLLLPFRLGNEPEAIDGYLELILGDPDPLPLLISRTVPLEDAIRAWTCALVGFADATCIDLEPTPPRQPRTRHRSASPAHRDRAPVSAAPRRQPWPSHLEPLGSWTAHGAFVAGHRRQLNNKTASDEARERARQVGIILHAHETWVKPHSRGIPKDIEVRFRWHAPRELLSQRPQGTGRHTI